MIIVKSIYDKPAKTDGLRILVDHLWPRGVSKEKADLHEWMKEISPTPELREWFNHDPARWDEFKKRYFKELENCGQEVNKLIDLSKKHTVTLLYAAHDEEHNNAVALKEYLDQYDSQERAKR